MNIGNLIFLVIFCVAATVLYLKLSLFIKYLKLAQPDNKLQDLPKRFLNMLSIAFGQRKILRDKFAGPMHAAIFWGFLILLFSASESVIQGFYTPFSWNILGPIYSVITLFTDIFCVLIFFAVIFALTRRFIIKVERLQGDKKEIKDALLVLFSILIIVTSLLLENAALRIMPNNSDWAFRPISALLSGLFSTGNAELIHNICWWVHIIVILSFANYLPYSKHFHVYTSIPNVFLSSVEPSRNLEPIKFEQEGIEKFGVVDIEDFSWRRILDSYTCTHCGRCTSVCPAHLTGKELSPMEVIVKIRERSEEKFPILLKQFNEKKLGSAETEIASKITEESQEILNKKFIGDFESIEALWQCTTCGACMQECPVAIEHVPAIIDLRRSLVMMESDFPNLLQSAFGSLGNNGSPWAFPQSARADWAEDTGVKTAAENPDFDVLFWVGCSGSFDERSQKISIAFSKLLQAANINFAILGIEEQCNGDVARRTGNEYLADMLIKANVETMNNYNVKKIVTFCPHCFNIIKNEYPAFGGKYEVYHHTDFLYQLISDGKLKINTTKDYYKDVIYHDSCYLGRYNNIYDAPRDILKNLNGINLLEAENKRDKGLCCGAGGGQMFLEETKGKRENIHRTEELMKSGAGTIALNCPFCMTMISDGVKAADKTEEIAVKDIAEIMLEYIVVE